MNMTNRYYSIVNETEIKIYINDVVHFKLVHDKIISYQSWIESKPILEVIKTFLFNLLFFGKLKAWKKKYVIEFILEDDVITLLEYDEKEKWVEILKLIDKIK